MQKKYDPYAALRFKEFNFFLIIRFLLVFAWSMQFIIIEWEVYNITKDPLALGLIGLAEIVPAISTALFAGHIVDQNEKKKLFVFAIFAFFIISLGFYFVTSNYVYDNFSSKYILIAIYSLVFAGGFVRAFFWTNYFFISCINSQQKNISKCSFMEQFYLAVSFCNWSSICRFFDSLDWN